MATAVLIAFATVMLLTPRTVGVNGQSDSNPILIQSAQAQGLQGPQEPIVKAYRVYRPTDQEIIEYIHKVFRTNADGAILIATCESGLNTYAYNPETEAKKKGITDDSSCGIFQHNDPRCVDTDADGLLDPSSKLADWKYNIDEAYQKFLARAWDPWRNCATKYNLL